MKLPSMQRNNVVCLATVSGAAGLAGSIITILLAISMVWALICLALKRFPRRFQRSDLYVVGPAWLFAAVILLAAVVHYDPATAGNLVSRGVALLPFIFFPLVLPRLRVGSSAALIDAFIFGAGLCGILVLPLAYLQLEFFYARASGGMGNALPFALVSSMMASVSLLNTLSPLPRRQVLGWAGFVAGILCVMLSQSRGVLPIPAIAVVMLLVLFPHKLRRFYNWKGGLLLIIGVAVVLAMAVKHSDRLIGLLSYFTEGSIADQSYTVRLALWKYAGSLFLESPWLGYGLQNRREFISALGYSFTHFHNGFITVTFDAGLAGLAATLLLLISPLLCVLRNPTTVARRKRLFMALLVLFGYTIAGSTNILFFQDIYDSVFLWFVLIVAAPLSMAGPAVCELRERVDENDGTR
ncbi:O-antigen ligase family protein [Neorhizobium sp. NPDC001467]|uniref:O-antigen ligase family protein n=1 Tax=Neorhizobium sp. NPDC001467 TaxID=3390595 RepID=UPI003CFD1234